MSLNRMAGLLKGLAIAAATAIGLSSLVVGCVKSGSDGDAGAPGAPGAPGSSAGTDTYLTMSEDLPGLVLTITGLTGGSGAGGNFMPGDTITVAYTIRKNDGSALPLNEVDSTAIWMSGPTTNYQHILPPGNTFSYSNMKTASVQQADGSYTYAFSAAIPATYGPPLFDTAKFTAGELTGQALLSGTYTVAMRMSKNYTDEAGTVYRDNGWATRDYLLGNAAALDTREVVKDANCNQCHVQIQMHGGSYRSTKLCVTCHTAGAEDRYSDTMGAADATPETIEFKVMIHRIHNGRHLPSVVGVTTDDTGARVYGAGTPYRIGGSGSAGTTPHDYSDINLPLWPNLSVGMPRDAGYAGLANGQRTQENEILRGVTTCEKCHGDPDGSGPVAAPAQGDLAYTQLTRRACGSCHDDVNWTTSYTSNGLTMPSQADDSACALCHVGSNNSLDPELAHKHPLFRKAADYPASMNFDNPGFVVNISSVTEPASDGNGNDNGVVEAGEKAAITFTVKDDAGNNLDLSADSSASLNGVINGPTRNYNLLVYAGIPRGVATGAASYTINMPAPYFLEYAGAGTASAGDTFTVDFGPIWSAYTSTNPVFLHRVTGVGAGSTLASASAAQQNYLDVADGAGSVFARGDFIVVDNDGGSEEYLRIQRVQADFSGTTDRLWFASPYQLSTVGTSAFSGTLNSATFGPWLRNAHASGAAVNKVTLSALTYTTDFTVSGSTITETATNLVGDGVKVIASYTGDFVVPSVYPATFNSSPDQDETWGKWEGKGLVEGTYTATIWGTRTFNMTPAGAATATGPGNPIVNDNTSYNCAGKGAAKNFLIGTSESVIEPYALISSSSNCDACHNELIFHGGGRRGFNTCLSCKGNAGGEDWPWYRASSSGVFPSIATDGLTINFRTMLHKIHMGEDLTHANHYVILGNSASQNMYEEVVFPAMPNRVKHCEKCHGSTNVAWQNPSVRTHPDDQSSPVRTYRAVCLACHDSDGAQGHYELMTSPSGYESCAACHDPNSIYQVNLVHKNR